MSSALFKIMNDSTTITWPSEDIKTLEDFCKKHGVVGFNCGHMSPIAALAFLKKKMGISDPTLTERTPYVGYLQTGNQKSVLHG